MKPHDLTPAAAAADAETCIAKLNEVAREWLSLWNTGIEIFFPGDRLRDFVCQDLYPYARDWKAVLADDVSPNKREKALEIIRGVERLVTAWDPSRLRERADTAALLSTADLPGVRRGDPIPQLMASIMQGALKNEVPRLAYAAATALARCAFDLGCREANLTMLALFSGFTYAYLARLAAEERLPAFKAGREWVIPRQSAVGWLASWRENPA